MTGTPHVRSLRRQIWPHAATVRRRVSTRRPSRLCRRSVGCTQSKRQRWPSSGIEAAMRIRSGRRNLVAWKQSVAPADRYSAPRFTRIAQPKPIRRVVRWLAWTLHTRWRPIFLVTGALLIVMWMALPSTMAFVPGILVLGLAVPDSRSDTGLFTPTTAMVRSWLHGRKADHS